MLRLRVLQGLLGGGLASLGALLTGGGLGLAALGCVFTGFGVCLTRLCRILAGLRVGLRRFCVGLAGLGSYRTCFGLLGLFGAGGHTRIHAVGTGLRLIRAGFRVGFGCFCVGLTGLGRVHALQRLLGVLRHLGHELLIDARRNVLGGRVGVDGVIAGVLAWLGHGNVAAVVDGQQHPGALFFQCPPPVYQCAVVLVQDLRVRLCAAQALHMQGHGAVLPLFRQLKAKLVHLGAPHTAQIQRLNVCPERRTVVLQLSDLDIQFAHSFTPFLPLSYHAPPGATTPDIHKFPPLDKYVKYVYNQITNEERRIPPPCR